MKESEYPTLPEDLGTDYGNPTLEDTALNYVLTDVPYASFNNAPDYVTRAADRCRDRPDLRR